MTDQEYQIEIEQGKRLLLGVQSIGDADSRGMRTVMCTLHGQIWRIQVRDRGVEADVKSAEKSEPTASGQVAAPFAGVVTLAVTEGDTVAVEAVLATIEAMKMEANITSSAGGTVSRVAIGAQQQVEGGDLVVITRPRLSPRTSRSRPNAPVYHAVRLRTSRSR